MAGMGEGIQQFGRQSLDVFMADARYVSYAWNGNVPQSSLSEIGSRNAKLILVGIRTLVGLAAVQLTCQALKAMTRLPRMTAFSLLDTTVVILFKTVVLHDIFKFTANLTFRADLREGILAGIFSEDSYSTDRNGRALNPFLEGTFIPSVWNAVLHPVQAKMEGRDPMEQFFAHE
jgi:hypothetical protein